MTEQLDPCEIIEIETPEEESGPSVLPVTQSQVTTIQAAFPVRENRIVENSTIRESILVNQQNFDFGIPYKKGQVRLPVEALPFNKPNDNMRIDPFRYSAGKFFKFEGNNLAFVNTSNDPNQKEGVFYNIKIGSNTISGIENVGVSLVFDKNMLNSMLQSQGFNSLVGAKFIVAYIFGDFDENTENWPPLVPRQFYDDETFAAPAAFYESEVGENVLSFHKDRVSITPYVGPLDIEETDSEYSKKSIYRHYKSRNLEGHSSVVNNDKIQKFSASNVEELNHINVLSTNFQVGGDLFVSSQKIVNNHVKISITADHDSNISKIFKDEKLDTYLLDYIDIYNSSSSPKYAQILDQSFRGLTPNNTAVLDYQPNRYSYDEFIGSDYGTRTMLQEARSEAKNYPLLYEDASINFDNQNRRDSIELDFRLLARKRTLKSKIRSFIEDKKRTFANILEGQKAYSEVVAYRVEKIDIQTGQLVQNFYFFNDPDVKELEFLDTQVVYQKMYEYKIYAINFVVGNSYGYQPPDPAEYSLQYFELPDPAYDFEVTNRTRLFFIETPYFKQQIKVIDKPPVPPEADILPFFQQDDKISFLMTPGTGTTREEPILIFSQDRQIMTEMLMNDPVGQGSITYTSDTLPSQYQMLMLESEPLEYSDFSEATAYTVAATGASAYIELNIEPNKDYYIIFRTIDPAGISNPSHVYKLRLNSYANGIFVEYNQFDMAGLSNKTPIEFERVLSIEPSFNQSAIKFDSLEQQGLDFYQTAPDLSDITLGLDSENRLWGRKFKVRLVSRSTSRAIDLNVEFQDSYKTIKVEQSLLVSSEGDMPPEEPQSSSQRALSREELDRRERASEGGSSSDSDRAAYEADPTRSAPLIPGY